MNRKRIVLLLGLVLVGASFLLTERTYDIQLYDTYVVISWNITLRIVGLFCALCSVGYLLLSRERAGR